MKKIVLILSLATLLTSCSIYKKYSRPEEISTDKLYGNLEKADTTSLADLSWREFFTDKHLQGYIEEALKNNIDMRLAAERVSQAEISLQSAKLAFIPSFSFAPSIQTESSKSYSPTRYAYSLPIAASWEIDIMGRQLNAKRRASAALEQSKLYRRSVQTALVAAVANSYYTLLMLDEQLKTSRHTLTTWEENIRTLDALKRAGKTNEAAVLQAKANKYSVEADVLTLEKKIMEMENSFCALIGVVPMPIERSTLSEQKLPLELSAGVPAELLSRRPDVRQAELNLAQCHYSKNIARAAFYPNVSLSGALGWTTGNGNIVIDPGSMIANLLASLTQPVFGRGVNKARMMTTEAQYDQAAYEFRQCLLDAGVEVNNALTMWQTAQRRVEIVKKQIISLKAAVWNTQLLMKHGNANYLEVLSAQKNLLQAELTETSDRLDEIRGVINLYHALGGGYEL